MKNIILCLCLILCLCGCEEIISESYSSGQNDSTENDIVSSIADDIASGINNKLEEIEEDAAYIYLGSSPTLKYYAEWLKSDDISSEMKESKYFEVISSFLRTDCICAEVGKSFADQDASISSFNYVATYYNIKTENKNYYYIVTAHDDDVYHFHTNYVNDELKEYFVEEVSTTDIEDLTGIGDILESYKGYAEYGKIIGSGNESVFGKDLAYEDISYYGKTIRFYFDDHNTMYVIDSESGAYYKLTNISNAKFRVPFWYTEVSRDQFFYDIKHK